MIKNKVKVAPSVLSADFAKMGEEVKDLELKGADYVHIDVMDGVFVKNIGFGIKMVKDIRKETSLVLDVHLMIVEPWHYVRQFAEAGADIITVHYEACKEKLADTLQLIKSTGKKCGCVINPDTPVEKITNVLPLCDIVLIMSVFPGQGGQKFIPDVLQKIRQLKSIVDASHLNVEIEVDGGVTVENSADIKRSGANVLVAGSTVFNSSDRQSVIEQLKIEY